MKNLVFILLFISSVTIFSQTITTVAGNGLTGYSGDGGTAITSSIYSPIGITVDGAGNLYISDQANNRIRKVNTGGIISTIAGNGTGGFGGDGGAANLAQLSNPFGITIDGSGNIYIADYSNNRVRKINSSGIISTIAGNGTAGYSGDGGPATSAQLRNPSAVAVDASGNIYFTDTNNHRVRKIDQSGLIYTIAGTGNPAYSGDTGPASAAELNTPSGIVIRSNGEILISDAGNSVIRKINTSGTIYTSVGNGNTSYSGDGGLCTAAEMNGPIGLALDQSGNLYIGDTFNQRVRMVNASSGIITTIAGNGLQGFSGDGSAANLAQLSLPAGIALDAAGNIYVADENNNRIRKISSMVGINESEHENKIKIYPIPCYDRLIIELNDGGYTDLRIKDVLGTETYYQKCNSSETNLKIDISEIPGGVYLLEICNRQKKIVRKIVKE